MFAEQLKKLEEEDRAQEEARQEELRRQQEEREREGKHSYRWSVTRYDLLTPPAVAGEMESRTKLGC